MGTQTIGLRSSGYVDAGLPTGIYLIEMCTGVASEARKLPAAYWRICVSQPAATELGHSLWASDWHRGSGAIKVRIPEGESLWLRGDVSARPCSYRKLDDPMGERRNAF